MGNNLMTQPCDEHAAMMSALPMLTSVHLAAASGRVKGISAFAAGSVYGSVIRERSVDGTSAVDARDIDVQRQLPIYNSTFAGGVRRSALPRPPV